MPAPTRAALARLHTLSAPRRRRIETTFAELSVANDALLTAASGLSAGLKQGMVDEGEVYELLRVIHLRLKQTIAEAKCAALNKGGAA
jgi:hypothetical protein